MFICLTHKPTDIYILIYNALIGMERIINAGNKPITSGTLPQSMWYVMEWPVFISFLQESYYQMAFQSVYCEASDCTMK